MEKLEKFSQIVKKGNYVFHLHTNLTDGRSTLLEYFELAKKIGKNFVFTEHIRKKATYDWKSYIDEVHKAGYLAGFEAKLTVNGDVDINKEAYENSDVLAIAIHSLNVKKYETLVSLLRMSFDKYSDNEIPIVWVHPYTSSVEKKIVPDKVKYIKDVMNGFESRIWIEFNIRRKNFSNEEVEKNAEFFKIVKGFDAHSVEELIEMLNRQI